MAQRATGIGFEAIGLALREAALSAGAKVPEGLLRDVGVGRRETEVRCRCATAMNSSGAKAQTVYTLLGEVRFERSRYACPVCAEPHYPGDEELGVLHTSRSPGLQHQTARLGAKEPFAEVAKDLRELASIRISRKDAERIGEAIGADMESRDATRCNATRTHPAYPSARARRHAPHHRDSLHRIRRHRRTHDEKRSGRTQRKTKRR